MNNHDSLPHGGAVRAGTADERSDTAPAAAIRSEPRIANTVLAAPVGRRRRKLGRYIVLAMALVIASLALGTYYWFFVAPYESTDDAFIDGDVTPIAPQVAGRVLRLMVTDNQPVNRGDVLLEIDPSDYQARLDQARANLAAARSQLEQSKAQLAVDQAKAEQQRANIIAADAEAKRAEADSKRYHAVGKGGVSESQLDLAATQAHASAAQLQVARSQETAAEAQVGLSQANIQAADADVRRAQAAVRQAELDLSYTQVTAPEAGWVTHRSVQVGAYVQTGQALLAIVPRHLWVVANFKETQLTHMGSGQPVEVSVDAYPQIKFKGHVDSIQAGAGARFSLMPPENASGNYVKVVQRVPVKIVIDDASNAGHVLGPGMSVEPEVKVK